jgi:hypothetical protein
MNKKRIAQNLAITEKNQALITSTQQLIIDIEKQITRIEQLRLKIALYSKEVISFLSLPYSLKPYCETSSRLQDIPSHHDNHKGD